MTVEKREYLTLPNGKALLLFARQDANSERLRKWLLIAPFGELTALVSFEVPSKASTHYPDAKVRAALAKHRNNPTSPEDLAQELGVSEQKLHDAFHAVMGKIRPRLHRRAGADDLAKQLGVTRAQLEAAFDKLRAQREDLRDQFAQELATKLGISVEKVQDAIDDFRPFGKRHP